LYFKVILYLVLIFSSVQAMLVGTPFINNDLKILREFDIDQTYLTDYALQKDIQKYLKHTQKKYTQKLNDAYLFIPQIKKVLKENNIPSAFLYMVMAESNFILNAHSNKKAKGLWQFMPKTAVFYGLEKDSYIDERMDIIKSTQAAAKYLNQLHKRFGKWYLAAIAYNCGSGRLIEGLCRAKIDMYCEDVGYKQCKKDKKILNFRSIISQYQHKKVSFSKLKTVYKKVRHWKYNLDINRLLTVQTIVKRQYIPNESRKYLRKIITLAIMNNEDFLLKDENLHLLNRGISDPIAKIKVKGGVRLSTLAQIIGLNLDKLEALNLHIRKNIIPLKKESYTIYIPYSKLARYNAKKQLLNKTIFKSYIVKSGDTLSKIASVYGTKYQLIKKYNNLKSNMLKVGQELIIPNYNMIKTNKSVYIIQSGDNLSKIAKKYKIAVKKLMLDNNLTTSSIKIGEKLVIKY